MAGVSESPPVATPTAPSPITVSITRRMTTDNETQILAWVHAGTAMAERFRGFLGTGWVRSTSDPTEWHMLYRFDSHDSLDAWEASPEREWWLATGAGMVSHTRSERRVGIEGWFDEPQEVVAIDPTPGRRAIPPRWKQATMIWLAFFPMSVLFAVLVGPHITEWHVVARTFASTIMLTPLMTYFVLPFAGRVLDGWLHKP